RPDRVPGRGPLDSADLRGGVGEARAHEHHARGGIPGARLRVGLRRREVGPGADISVRGINVASETPLQSIRTDHTGGLAHPDWLHDLYARYGEGTASEE